MIHRNGDGKLVVDWKIVTMLVSLVVAGVSAYATFMKDKALLERSSTTHDNAIREMKEEQAKVNSSLNLMNIRLSVIESQLQDLKEQRNETSSGR